MTKEITCYHCGKVVERKTGNQKYCPECRPIVKRQRDLARYHRCREEILARARGSYQEHREEIRAYRRKYRQAFREECRAKQREYYLEHREELLAYSREYKRRQKLAQADIN